MASELSGVLSLGLEESSGGPPPEPLPLDSVDATGGNARGGESHKTRFELSDWPSSSDSSDDEPSLKNEEPPDEISCYKMLTEVNDAAEAFTEATELGEDAAARKDIAVEKLKLVFLKKVREVADKDAEIAVLKEENRALKRRLGLEEGEEPKENGISAKRSSPDSCDM